MLRHQIFTQHSTQFRLLLQTLYAQKQRAIILTDQERSAGDPRSFITSVTTLVGISEIVFSLLVNINIFVLATEKEAAFTHR